MTYTKLDSSWLPGPDGMRWRRAARVLLIDDSGSQPRVLLIRGHDADQPSRSWWFSVGGGIDAGETPHQAAVREVREETGIVLDPEQVVGPVLTRSAIFDFFKESCRQDEEYFLAYVPGMADGFSDHDNRAGWTDIERELLDEMKWFTPTELRAQPLEYFPKNLPEIVESLADGWNGELLNLGKQDDDERHRIARRVRAVSDIRAVEPRETPDPSKAA